MVKKKPIFFQVVRRHRIKPLPLRLRPARLADRRRQDRVRFRDHRGGLGHRDDPLHAEDLRVGRILPRMRRSVVRTRRTASRRFCGHGPGGSRLGPLFLQQLRKGAQASEDSSFNDRSPNATTADVDNFDIGHSEDNDGDAEKSEQSEQALDRKTGTDIFGQKFEPKPERSGRRRGRSGCAQESRTEWVREIAKTQFYFAHLFEFLRGSFSFLFTLPLN